jgi:hypothetical protein
MKMARIQRRLFVALPAIGVLGIATVAFAQTEANSDSKNEQVGKRRWGRTVEGQALSIMTNKNKYAPLELILLDVVLKNVAKVDIYYINGAHPFDMYTVKVLLPDGKEAPYTRFGNHLSQRRNHQPATTSSVLKPGKQVSDSIELTRLYDMSLSGDYTISLQRQLWRGDAIDPKLKIESNSITITIKNTVKHTE